MDGSSKQLNKSKFNRSKKNKEHNKKHKNVDKHNQDKRTASSKSGNAPSSSSKQQNSVPKQNLFEAQAERAYTSTNKLPAKSGPVPQTPIPKPDMTGPPGIVGDKRNEESEMDLNLASKSYSKRRMESNWARYVELPTYEDFDEVESRGADFKDLISNTSISYGDHKDRFMLKEEKEWLKQSESIDSPFSLDLLRLAAGVSSIPFFERHGLSENSFSPEQVQSMIAEAKLCEVAYRDMIKSAGDNETVEEISTINYTAEQENYIKKSNHVLKEAPMKDDKYMLLDRNFELNESRLRTLNENEKSLNFNENADVGSAPSSSDKSVGLFGLEPLINEMSGGERLGQFNADPVNIITSNNDENLDVRNNKYELNINVASDNEQENETSSSEMPFDVNKTKRYLGTYAEENRDKSEMEDKKESTQETKLEDLVTIITKSTSISAKDKDSVTISNESNRLDEKTAKTSNSIDDDEELEFLLGFKQQPDGALNSNLPILKNKLIGATSTNNTVTTTSTMRPSEAKTTANNHEDLDEWLDSVLEN